MGSELGAHSPAFNEDERMMILEFPKGVPDAMGPSRLIIGEIFYRTAKSYQGTRAKIGRQRKAGED